MGFGIWTDGRHELSARWSDVARVAAVQEGAGRDAPPRISLLVTLADRREIELAPEDPGWDAFLAAAPGMLSGRPSATAWQPALTRLTSADAATVVLYERRTGRR
jgi:hypothetical protein